MLGWCRFWLVLLLWCVLTVLLGAAALTAGVVAPAVASNAPVAPAALCGRQPAANQNLAGHFTGGGVRLRTGPSLTCTVKGLGYPADAVVYRCWAWGDSFSWTYLTDVSTGVTGWVRDDQITGPLVDPACCTKIREGPARPAGPSRLALTRNHRLARRRGSVHTPVHSGRKPAGELGEASVAAQRGKVPRTLTLFAVLAADELHRLIALTTRESS